MITTWVLGRNIPSQSLVVYLKLNVSQRVWSNELFDGDSQTKYFIAIRF